MRGPRSPALEEGIRAPMGATGECSAGPHTQCRIHVTLHWLLLIPTSDIKHCDYLYLSFYRRWKSSSKANNTEFSDMSLFRSLVDKDTNSVWPILSMKKNITVQIIYNFCVISLLYQASAHNTFYIIWSTSLRRLSECYSTHNKCPSWHLTNRIPLTW